jgi:hypothetical protein
MKRIIGTAIAALTYSVVVPLAAWAQDGSGLGPPGGGGVSGGGGSIGGGPGVSGTGGVAFTGAEIAGLVTFALVLLVVGITLVRATRKRLVTARTES